MACSVSIVAENVVRWLHWHLTISLPPWRVSPTALQPSCAHLSSVIFQKAHRGTVGHVMATDAWLPSQRTFTLALSPPA
jgi:hypothetical protein